MVHSIIRLKLKLGTYYQVYYLFYFTGLQHFSFSPGNVENMPPPLSYPPGSFNPPLPWNQNNQHFPDKRLVVNARQR